MSDWLRDGALVGAGGFLGALGRFLITGWFQARIANFPYGTLAVNLIGSLALGFLVTALAERLLADSSFRLLAMVGFLGAFTTFSAFSNK
jgi:CrcB protein